MSQAKTPHYAPLPQAPTAQLPAALATTHAVAHVAWQPNILTWITSWRILITIELAVVLLAGIAAKNTMLVLLATALWSTLTAGAMFLRLKSMSAVVKRSALLVDLSACVGLILLTQDSAARSLVAAYACSTVIGWASFRPADGFIAAAACAGAFFGKALFQAGGLGDGDALLSTLGLYFFFALATSGFFTVANRIGALEIAAEISRERGRYRRDLHDRLGQALSGMHFEVQAVHAVGLDEQAPDRLLSLADGYRDALRMLKDLFKAGDEPLIGTNISSIIQQEARRMGQQANVRVDVETTGDASRVPAWMRPHIVAVAGESVNNALKNGHAQGIDISVDVTDELVVLSVTDDGVGFDNPPGTITEKVGHYGLREMAERARLCGGEVVIASQPGFGTRVRLQVPIPENATQDILERDASKLRENVWSLVTFLRIVLGVTATAQLLVFAFNSTPLPLFSLLLAVVVLVDVAAGFFFSSWLRRALASSPLIAYSYIVIAGGALLGCLWNDTPTAPLLYVPLALLYVGIAVGRRAAMVASLLLLLLVCGAGIGAFMFGKLGDAEMQELLIHLTNTALIGMAAIQGAKLLDRLETLQIRVRFQVLARMRHGLSGRMRDQLTERLEQLEKDTRQLAHTDLEPPMFSEATERIQEESTQLKQRLREIVHTLAEPNTSPPTGRTNSYV